MAAPLHAPPLTLASLGFTCRVVGERELDGGAAHWLSIGPAPGSSELTTRLDRVELVETGVVALLDVINRGPLPALLPANLILDGGKQTRIVERSVLVPPGQAARVPIKCVEQGRWTPGGEGESRFSASGYSSVSTRTSIHDLKHQSLRMSGRYQAEQSSVWGHVREELTKSRVASSTNSYGDYMSAVRRKQVALADSAVGELPEGANAVLMQAPRTWVSMEVYPLAAALKERAPSLLADLMDPELAPRSGKVDCSEALRRIGFAELTPIATVEGTLGQAYSISDQRLRGEVLTWAGRIVHLSATATASA